MTTNRVRYTYKGRVKVGQVNTEQQRVRCSGGAWQDLPVDSADYRFNHGGDEFRTLVEVVWQFART